MDISFNELSGLKVQHLKNVSKLKELKINSNRISSLPHGIFDNTKELANLSLDCNPLSALPRNMFSHNPSVIEFKLEHRHCGEYKSRSRLSLSDSMFASRKLEKIEKIGRAHV